MSGATDVSAIDRIEAALARIEAAAASSRAESDQWQDRHTKLRATVEQSLAALDALIEASRS